MKTQAEIIILIKNSIYKARRGMHTTCCGNMYFRSFHAKYICDDCKPYAAIVVELRNLKKTHTGEVMSKINQLYSIGDKFKITSFQGNKIFKLMAYSDGYYMARYPRCVPFAIAQSDLSGGITYGDYEELQ